MLNHKRIGRQIKELRMLRNWKQYELADKVGLSRPAICNIENGKRALWNSVIKNIMIDEDLNITLVFRS